MCDLGPRDDGPLGFAPPVFTALRGITGSMDLEFWTRDEIQRADLPLVETSLDRGY